MKETPLLMRGPLVAATLEGRKTQTRRVMTEMRVDLPRSVRADVPGYGRASTGRHRAEMNGLGAVSCDIGSGKMLGLKPGEFNWVCRFSDGETTIENDGWQINPNGSRLWVKETFAVIQPENSRGVETIYRASWQDTEDWDGPWKPSIFMPRCKSRLDLEIVSIRVERLQDISEADAIAEGVKYDCAGNNSYRDQFHMLWESINGKKYPWARNPWVWVIAFNRIGKRKGARHKASART